MADDGKHHQEFRARRVDGTNPDGNSKIERYFTLTCLFSFGRCCITKPSYTRSNVSRRISLISRNLQGWHIET